MRRLVVLATIVMVVASTGIAAAKSDRPAASPVPVPTVSGPVTGGKGAPTIIATTFDPATVGYAEEEYLVAGTATAYTATGTPPSDGRVSAAPGATAPYKTRILVFRPQDAADFNGTVVVEWLNVTAGADTAPDWLNAHNALIREGFAWVGVSAQAVGVVGGSTIVGAAATGGIKAADPDRYGTLEHPGDSFSYDIYSQVGQALRQPSAVDPLGGLRPKRVIAVGESQSAFRMVTYVDAIHPVARVYDGFLIHSRGGSAAALSQDPQPKVDLPTPIRIRTDLDVPVLTFETETDVEGLRFLASRQPDSKRFRLWEVAGTAHADAYTIGGAGDTGGGQGAVALLNSVPNGGPLGCDTPINTGPQYAVLSAAFVQLDRWVRTGKPAPRAPRFTIVDGKIARDDHGNALGGIRTPLVDAPVSALSGSGQTGASFCRLFGTTRPFDAATLSTLYPTHDAYVTAFEKSANRAVRAGFLLAADARQLVAAAEQSTVGTTPG